MGPSSSAPSSIPSSSVPSSVPSSSAPSSIPTMMPTVTNIEADRQHIFKLLSQVYALDMVPGQSPESTSVSTSLNFTFYSPMFYTDTEASTFVAADGAVSF